MQARNPVTTGTLHSSHVFVVKAPELPHSARARQDYLKSDQILKGTQPQAALFATHSVSSATATHQGGQGILDAFSVFLEAVFLDLIAQSER